ncbi:hypothetical protein [Nocardia sp. NPDC057455]|uniref:hypothetical protein n=1 Tax=Nocardia sp. NPDC057455 TaxID=3346138 RepID=UPI00366EF5B8
MTTSLDSAEAASNNSSDRPEEFVVESGRWWSRRGDRVVPTDLARRVALAEKQLLFHACPGNDHVVFPIFPAGYRRGVNERKGVMHMRKTIAIPLTALILTFGGVG